MDSGEANSDAASVVVAVDSRAEARREQEVRGQQQQQPCI